MGLAVQFSLLLLPLLSQCLPSLDEICRRSLNCIKVCIRNGSSLVRTIANYGIQYTVGIIHYLAITCYVVHNYITVVLKTLLAVRLIALLIIIRLS